MNEVEIEVLFEVFTKAFGRHGIEATPELLAEMITLVYNHNKSRCQIMQSIACSSTKSLSEDPMVVNYDLN